MLAAPITPPFVTYPGTYARQVEIEERRANAERQRKFEHDIEEAARVFMPGANWQPMEVQVVGALLYRLVHLYQL